MGCKGYSDYGKLVPALKSVGGNKSEKKEEEKAPEASAAAAEKIDFSKVEIGPLFKDFVDFETFSKSDFRAVKVLECETVPKSRKLLKFVLDDGTAGKRVILILLIAGPGLSEDDVKP